MISITRIEIANQSPGRNNSIFKINANVYMPHQTQKLARKTNHDRMQALLLIFFNEYIVYFRIIALT